MMESPCKWYPLPDFPGLPPLLVSAGFEQSSYTLHITDLSNIWVEKLDRRGILLRSLQENTSIDLVDADPEQWAVFLSKLKAALDPTSSDHHLTGLGIAADPQSNNKDGITLCITCELPKPLHPLKWPVRLLKCQPASLASELVLPLIRGHYRQRREAEDLMKQLNEKDALITKLLDKLNTMHTPLELIFNSLSAKHTTSRAAAEDKIKGLAAFDEENWRSQRNIESPQSAPALLRSVFGDPRFNCATHMDMGVSDTLNDWWAKLGPSFRAASKLESNSSLQERREEATIKKDSPEDIDNADFQVQVTPTRTSLRRPSSSKSTEGDATHETAESEGSSGPVSHPTRSPNKPRSKIGTLGSTKLLPQHHSASQSSRTLQTDEDNTASESEDAEPPESPKHARQSNTRLGTIGKPRQSPQPKNPVATKEPSADVTDDTASGSDSDSDNPPRLPSSPKGAPATPRKATLGRIGGKPNNNISPQNQRKSTSGTASDDSVSPKKTEVRKIGALGRKSQTETKRVHSDTPIEPETDEQKAERKRAELAKELNRQTVVPARKKRKF
ncbi:XLF-domain-containing protein [Nemania diffusa]|nr:XLF-domain-containing protein [Nemania diffusa]